MPRTDLLQLPPPGPEGREEDDQTREAACSAAHEVLASGGVVGLPTETVYGLAARADVPEGLERLRELKQRGAAPDQVPKTFTWHIADHEVLAGFPELPGIAGRIAERYMPGPVTLVLRGGPAELAPVQQDGWTGVRMPAHAGALQVLSAAGGPVVATSANPPGSAPATTAAGVLETFDGEIDLVLDGGPSGLGESSTVLRLGRGHFDLLREGLVSGEDLRRTGGLHLGFVCTGNTCRSPMAEAIARQVISEHLGVGPERLPDFGFHVFSAGVWAEAGMRASDHSIEVMRDQGIDIAGHTSTPIGVIQAPATARLFGLTASHAEAMVASFPPDRSELIDVLDPRGANIVDPIGGPKETYAQCAAQIRAAIEARVVEWI